MRSWEKCETTERPLSQEITLENWVWLKGDHFVLKDADVAADML